MQFAVSFEKDPTLDLPAGLVAYTLQPKEVAACYLGSAMSQLSFFTEYDAHNMATRILPNHFVDSTFDEATNVCRLIFRGNPEDSQAFSDFCGWVRLHFLAKN